MGRILVWDLPVRLFHWFLAASFVGAFAIANLAGDESTAFALHMLLGGVAAFMVLLRIVWGLVGSRWARFSSFAASPKELFVYVRGALAGGGRRYTGHNPGSSLAALLMFALILGLAATGVLMGSGGGEAFEEIHELLAWAMVAVIGAHIVGIVWHTIRHRENIAVSMVDGRKEAEPSGAIASAKPGTFERPLQSGSRMPTKPGHTPITASRPAGSSSAPTYSSRTWWRRSMPPQRTPPSREESMTPTVLRPYTRNRYASAPASQGS